MLYLRGLLMKSHEKKVLYGFINHLVSLNGFK
jgi:hypothetical protein